MNYKKKSAMLVVILLASFFYLSNYIITDFHGNLFNILFLSGIVLLNITLFYFAISTSEELTGYPIQFPKLSIIIPVKNEEDNIHKVLENIILTNYDKEKIELIIVNDGSTDSTQSEIEKFKHSYEDSFSIVFLNFTVNKGKKNALIKGIKKSSGDYVVFIDSDTYLEEDSLVHLISGFDDETAAVCGETLIRNRNKLIARIQDYEYYITHNFFKSFENHYGSVLCAPGCFSACRKETIIPLLPKFEKQKIINFETDLGEDRYLTALLLKETNLKVKYVSTAKAKTVAPDTLNSYLKQRTRWIKAWFVNSIFLFPYIITKPLPFIFYFIVGFFSPILILLMLISVGVLLSNEIISIPFVVLSLAIQVIFVISRNKGMYLVYPLLFYLFSMLIYPWLIPYSLLNIKSNTWGTR